MNNLSFNVFGKNVILGFAAAALILSACSKGVKHEPEERILAKVGDRTISANEFIKRAEYTIRPNYAKLDYYLHKKIILNSLIAEKLFALEEADSSQLMQNPRFLSYIKGRKEQTMRTFMYQSMAQEKVKVSEDEIRNEYEVAGRKYKVAWFSLTDTADVRKMDAILDTTSMSFEEVSSILTGKEQPQVQEVAWEAREHPVLHDALFKGRPEKDDIIKSLKVEEGHYMFMKVLGWTDSQVLNESGIQQRWADAEEKVYLDKSEVVWMEYVADVMAGKEARFNEDTFFEMVEILGPQYFHSQSEMKEAFNKKFWENEEIKKAVKALSEPEFRNSAFVQIDDDVWTVQDFLDMLDSHPLVFRRRNFDKPDFAEEFKYAAVDAIRDHFVTQEGYKKGYDKANVVQREEAIWRDSFIGKEHRFEYLNKIGETRNFSKDYYYIMEDHLNAYVDSLQTKYTDQIEIDTDLFESLDLTRIDLYATYTNAAYSNVVPDFPVYTTDHHLDYGKKMEKE